MLTNREVVKFGLCSLSFRPRGLVVDGALRSALVRGGGRSICSAVGAGNVLAEHQTGTAALCISCSYPKHLLVSLGIGKCLVVTNLFWH
jgi:hypothetical protein